VTAKPYVFRPTYFFWQPFLRYGGYVVVCPHRTKYRGGISPRDALAAANVFALLSRWDSKAIPMRLEVRDSLLPEIERENLVLIGSASANPVVSSFLVDLNGAKTPLSFSLGSGFWNDRARKKEGNPANLNPKYVTDALDLGAQYCIEDFGLLARAPNPHSPGKVITFIAGIHGYGTLAASHVFCDGDRQREIEDHLKGERIKYAFAEDPEAVVEVLLRASVSQDPTQFAEPVREIDRIAVKLVRVGSRIERQSITNSGGELWTHKRPRPRKSSNLHHFSMFFPEREPQRAFVHVQGLRSVMDFRNAGFTEEDCDSYDSRISNALIQTRGWEKEIRKIGKELEERLQPALALAPQEGLDLPPHELIYRFGGPSHHLRLPFEATRIQNDLSYLALIHPVVRSITGLSCTKRAPDAEFTDALRLQGKKLRVLLVASNPLGDLPAVEAEIAGVEDTLSKFRAWIDVDTLTGQHATSEAFSAALGADCYHILHYAGHTHWNRENPRRSHFVLRSPNGGAEEVFLEQVEDWLREGSPLCFCYLSSCEGTRAGESYRNLTYDFFGIADSLVRAGVPAVLGYRARIDDVAAQVMAETFYHHLCISRVFSLSQALLQTRKQVRTKLMYQPSWLMPILIIQH
jgi:CHAT domain-containing protein